MRVVLVLNADYSPMNITSLKKSFKLIFKGKAEIVSEDHSFTVTTDKRIFYKPSIIRLVKYVSYPYKRTVDNHIYGNKKAPSAASGKALYSPLS